MSNRLRSLVARVQAHLTDEDGQGLVEYGMILSLVAVLCVGALGVLQQAIDVNISNVAAGL